MRYGRAIAVAGLMAGLVGMAPEVGLLGIAPVVAQTVEQRKAEADLFLKEGVRVDRANQLQDALATYQKALLIYREIGDGSREGTTLSNMGIVYRRQGNYSKALELHQQALAIRKKIGERKEQGTTLNAIAMVYLSLGDYPKALEYHEQALKIRQEVRDTYGESITLANMGATYRNMQNDSKALEFYERSLRVNAPPLEGTVEGLTPLRESGPLTDSSGNVVTKFHLSDIGPGSGTALSGICSIQTRRKNYTEALKFCERALVRNRINRNQFEEGITLGEIGDIYTAQNQYSKALEFYQRALVISQVGGDRYGEGFDFAKMGYLFAIQNQPELAIAFYKQAVNVRESIRQDNRKLDLNLQETFAQSVSVAYRNLADLLIQQGRLSEAQAVLELLKLQELQEFTRDAGIQSAGISLAKVEEAALKQILAQFTTVGNFTQKLAQCQQTNCPTLRQLQQQRDDLDTAVQGELRQQRAILAKHFSTEASTLNPERLNGEAQRIVNAQPGTVLIYPLVLKDKIQFLVAFPAGSGRRPIFRPFEAKISAQQLFKTIQTFRNHLSEITITGRPKADLKTVQASSQQLYTWLIKPLEAELKNSAIKHLVFAPDSTTRYIPLASLYDGQQYLIQRFTISTITAASQTDTTTRTPTPTGQTPMLLAMGASTFQNQSPLPNVPAELEAIAKTNSASDRQGIYPGSKFLNNTFDYEALKTSLEKGTYRILHLATHGAFVPGRVEDSYLLPGSGRNLTTELIDQLGNYGLGNIHLVVLSALHNSDMS